MMNLDLIQEKAWKSMGKRFSHPDREPGYAYYHGQRVAKVALQLRELIFPEEVVHDDIIIVASWFHDVGKGIEPHWESGAVLCRQILQGHCPPELLEKIVEIVGAHALRKTKEYPDYVKLVQDADILDHFGSQEIWLNFWHAAYRRESMEYTLDFYKDFYLKNVQKIRSLLNYPVSIRFFDEKDRFVRDFINRFEMEGKGILIKG